MTRHAQASDRIHINGIRCRCHIGVPHLEREELQELRIDVILELDFRKAVQQDDFTQAVDYEEVVNIIQATARARRFSLLETLADALISELMGDSRIESVHIVVHKYPKVLLDRINNVAVEMLRRRKKKHS